MAKKTYTVVNAVEHGTTGKDIERYEPGSTIELDDQKHAPQLLAVGAIKAAEEADKAEK